MSNKYEEINQLVSLAKKNCVKSKEILITRLEALIKSSIKKYYYNRNTYDDLYQEGILIVLECIDTYDFNKQVYFLGYVKLHLKYYYLDRYKEIENISLESEIKDMEGLTVMDSLEATGKNQLDLLLEEENFKELNKYLENLSKREKQVILLNYYENISMKRIGEILGISYWTVTNIRKKQ